MNTAGFSRWNLVSPGLFLAAGALFCLLAWKAPIGDFGNYYFGSRLRWQGTPAAGLYDPCRFNALVRQEPGMQDERFFLNYTPVPPFSLLFYAPFTKLS